MKTIHKLLFVLAIILVGQISLAQGFGLKQDSAKFLNNKFWVDLNPGLGTCGNSDYENSKTDLIGINIDLNFLSKNYRYLKVRFGINEEIGLFSNFYQSTTEIDLMSGKLYQYKSLMFAVSAGLGLITGSIKGKRLPNDPNEPGLISTKNYERIDFVTIGIPFDIKANYAFTSWGLGVGIAGNLNAKLNYIIPYLNIQFALPRRL